MTDREKVQTIRMWINEAIHQGNRTVLVMAIKAILDLENDIEVQKGVVKLSEERIETLEKENAELKELIKNIIRVTWGEGWNYSLDWKVKAEQFLKEEQDG